MKKKINIIGIIILLLSVGVTIAYLQSTDTFENIFNAGTYSVVTHEEFTSPDNWAPGNTTNKTITTTNEGTIPVRVRVKLEENWISKNGNPLDLTFKKYIDVSKVKTENVSIINFANQEDWIKDGDYYYFVGELAPGETTSSLIESVTFNPEYHGDITCTTVDNVETCESSNDGYIGGTYTLNITTETVQSDAYQEVWNLSYNPTVERTIYDISDGNEYGTYEETGKNIFIRKTMLGELTTLKEIGFVYNDNLYYLKVKNKNKKNIYYEENKELLLNIFENENCTIVDDGISCGNEGLNIFLSENHLIVNNNNPKWNCVIHEDEGNLCFSDKQ